MNRAEGQTEIPMTSQAWWAATKANPKALEAWLYDQFRGEATAGERVDALRDEFAVPGTRTWRVLTVIAAQERKHGTWVAELLRARGLEPEIRAAPERYWSEVLPLIGNLETGAAVGAHAENMRLERIEAIASDEDAPADIRAVFRRILPEERFHERAFRSLASAEAMERTAGAHSLGRIALGLSA